MCLFPGVKICRDACTRYLLGWIADLLQRQQQVGKWYAATVEMQADRQLGQANPFINSRHLRLPFKKLVPSVRCQPTNLLC